MSAYSGFSLREIYIRKCDELGCKKNSSLLKVLPTKPDLFDIPVSLDLSTNFVGAKGLLALLEVVRCCTGLVSIDLRDQQMTNESVAELALVLARHPSVQRINLGSNPISLSAGTTLLELAKANPLIDAIGLDGTDVRPVVVNTINNQLEKNKRAKRPPSTAAGEGGTGAVNANGTQDGGDSLPTMDVSVLRATVSTLSTSVSSILFDESPFGVLNETCAKYQACFVDPQFPHEPSSVQRAPIGEYGVTSWRRAAALFPQATLFPELNPVPMPLREPTRRSSLSWLFSCIAEVCDSDDVRAMVTSGSGSGGANPLGLYCVRFFIDGAFRYVVVDDFLPININGEPAFASPQNNFLWPCIVEKAFAKLHGSYQALDLQLAMKHPLERRVSCATSMCDLCGGVGISRDLHHEEFNAEDWWNTLLDLHCNQQTSLLATTARETPSTTGTATTTAGAAASSRPASRGIVSAMAYRVLHVRAINGFRLLQLYCPWAETTWSGEWSPKSHLWEQYPDIAQALDARNSKPGSFWIPYSLFLQHFAAMHLCRRFPNSQSRLLEGAWNRLSSGGPYFEQSWSNNPRYRLSLTARGAVFINLSLPDTRFVTSDCDTLAFHVIRGDYYPIRFDKENLVAKTSYVITNSVSFDGVFDEGDYWIIPSTYVVGRMGKYMLRVFSSTPFVLRHEDIGMYWKQHEEERIVECSGEYQNGEDNLQLALTLPPGADPPNVAGTKLLVRMHTPEDEQLSLALFLCDGRIGGAVTAATVGVPPADSNDAATAAGIISSRSRIVGPIPDESVLVKSKFLISNTVFLDAFLPAKTAATTTSDRSESLVVVPCINPERTKCKVRLTFWCSNPRFGVRELPLWKRKTVVCQWTASGPYQDADNNPQIELVTPIPNMVFVIKVAVENCSDPSLIFFVVNNKGRVGEPIRGRISDAKIVMKSTFIRFDSILKDFHNGANPSDSYLIVPCLLPVGSQGRCVVTVSSVSDDFQLHSVI